MQPLPPLPNVSVGKVQIHSKSPQILVCRLSIARTVATRSDGVLVMPTKHISTEVCAMQVSLSPELQQATEHIVLLACVHEMLLGKASVMSDCYFLEMWKGFCLSA